MVGEVAFIGALCFVVRNFATFRNLIKTKAIVDAYGYDYLLHAAQRGTMLCHIGVGFLLFVLLSRHCEGLELQISNSRSALFCVRMCATK